MKYIRPEIEINAVQTEDIMAISDALKEVVSFVGGSTGADTSVNVERDGETGIKIDAGADFFG